MATYDQFKQDEILEKNGLTLDLGSAGRFKIARAGGANQSFTKEFIRLTKPYRRAIQTETMDEETSRVILREAFSKHIILGWEGVTGPDGEVLPFTRENCLKLLADLPQLFEEIRRAAEDASLYRAQTLKVDAGN
jgi:hypothetical protein